MTDDATLFHVLTAVGELKAQLIGLTIETSAGFAAARMETREGFAAANRRLDIGNGRLGKGEEWMNKHDHDHDIDTGEQAQAAAFAAGRTSERAKAWRVVTDTYDLVTSRIFLGSAILVLVGVAGWLDGRFT